MVWAALSRSQNAVALTGFTSPGQVRMNVAALAMGPPSSAVLDTAREIMSSVAARLDAEGEVFIDER